MKEDAQREALAQAAKAKARQQYLQINHITTIGLEELEKYVPPTRNSLNITSTNITRDTIALLE